MHAIPSTEITLSVLCIMTRGIAGSQVTLCGEWNAWCYPKWKRKIMSSYYGQINHINQYSQDELAIIPPSSNWNPSSEIIWLSQVSPWIHNVVLHLVLVSSFRLWTTPFSGAYWHQINFLLKYMFMQTIHNAPFSYIYI